MNSSRNDLLKVRNCLLALANGCSPETGECLNKKSVFNEPDVIRNLYSAVRILDLIIGEQKNNGPIASEKEPVENKVVSKEEFNIKDVQIKQIEVFSCPISITKLTNRINKVIDHEKMKGITYKQITSWLIENGFIEERTAFNKKYKYALPQGVELGIINETGQISGEKFMATLYYPKAQRFIVDNLPAIINGDVQGKEIVKDNNNSDDYNYLKHYKNSISSYEGITIAAAKGTEPKYGYNTIDGSPHAKPTPTMGYKKEYWNKKKY